MWRHNQVLKCLAEAVDDKLKEVNSLTASKEGCRGGEVSQLRHRGEDAASGHVASLAAYCTVTRDGEGEGVQKAFRPGGVCVVCLRVCVCEPKDSISTQTQQCLYHLMLVMKPHPLPLRRPQRVLIQRQSSREEEGYSLWYSAIFQIAELAEFRWPL